MTNRFAIQCLFLMLFLIVIPSSIALGWDIYYDGSVLPTDPSLGINAWLKFTSPLYDYSLCTTENGFLHTMNRWPNTTAAFSRFVSSDSVTVEAQLRVDGGGMWMSVAATNTNCVSLGLYPDHIDTYFLPHGVEPDPFTQIVDLTRLRTVRVAIDSTGEAYVWVDGSLIANGIPTRTNQGNIGFSTDFGLECNAYWDYVAYSGSFVPVPEPSSLLALGMALAGVGIIRKRRLI